MRDEQVTAKSQRQTTVGNLESQGTTPAGPPGGRGALAWHLLAKLRSSQLCEAWLRQADQYGFEWEGERHWHTDNQMLPSLFNSTTLPVLEQVVNFTEARHGVLAGNIANLDTPGYRTRDLSPVEFQEQLKNAIESSRSQQTSQYRTAAGAIADGRDKYAALREVRGSMKDILYHDESDVSLEQQVTEIGKNQAQHNLAISIMAAQFRLLRAAITEQVG